MIRQIRPFAKTLTAISAALAAMPAQAAGFSSPSGNIRCYADLYNSQPLDEVDLICLIFEADWDLPPDYGDDDPTCDLDRTRSVFLPAQGAPRERWICHGDVFWPAPLGKISYGSNWSLFGFSCDVARNGVTCRNATDHSISVARAARALN